MASIAAHGAESRAATRRYEFPNQILTRRNAGIFFAVTALLLTIDGILHTATRFDVRIINAVQGLDAPYLAQVIRAVSALTSSTGAMVMWTLTLLTFASIRWWLPALATATLPVGGVLNFVVGEFVVGRARPDEETVTRIFANYHGASFPSGHVMGAVMLYGMLFFIARRIDRSWVRLSIQSTSLFIILAVGFTRVWEGAHWPTDVLGAYAYGGLLLVALFAIYTRIDAVAGHLPFFRAGTIAHSETVRHTHALTSVVFFNRNTVSKVYNPGFVPRALYWLAFQAPFAYERNDAALRAAAERRNLAAMLTEYWYGSERVARVVGIDRIGGRPALTSTLITGHAPTNRHDARAFLTDLRSRFDDAGLPTWQIDPRQPRAIDNLIETEDGGYKVVDLESGLVSPLASFRSWGRALRSGHVPMFDTVHVDVTRAYVETNEAAMRSTMGDAWYSDVRDRVSAVDATARAWYATERRIWSTIFGVRSWKSRIQSRMDTGQDRAMGWLTSSVAMWEAEGRISRDEAADLRARMETPQFQAVIPHLGAHVVITVLLRFPFGSVARVLWTAWALLAVTVRLLARRAHLQEWRQAWSIHNPVVMLLAAVPGFGAFSYLAAGPIRSSRLLVRVTVDALMFKIPWRLYERTGMRRMLVIGRQAGAFYTVTDDHLSDISGVAQAGAYRSEPDYRVVLTPNRQHFPALEPAAWD
jgi:undecaprenyl-diphosphatase